MLKKDKRPGTVFLRRSLNKDSGSSGHTAGFSGIVNAMRLRSYGSPYQVERPAPCLAVSKIMPIIFPSASIALTSLRSIL